MTMTGLLDAAEILTLAERETGAYGLADEGLKARLGIVVDWANRTGPYDSMRLAAVRAQVREAGEQRGALDVLVPESVARYISDHHLYNHHS